MPPEAASPSDQVTKLSLLPVAEADETNKHLTGENMSATSTTTTDKALEMKITDLEKELKETKDSLKTAIDTLEKYKQGDVLRLKRDILAKAPKFSSDELDKLSPEELRMIDVTLDRAGSKAASVKPILDTRRATDGLSVGRWDQEAKKWVEG